MRYEKGETVYIISCNTPLACTIRKNINDLVYEVQTKKGKVFTMTEDLIYPSKEKAIMSYRY